MKTDQHIKKIHVFKESAIATTILLLVTYLISFVPWSLEYAKALHQGFADFDIYDLYYSEKNKNSNVEQIILSGETAKLPGIDIFFADRSGIETVIGNPWKSINSGNIPKEILTNAPAYSIAVGLALKEYER